MALVDYANKPLPNLAFYCDMSHKFSELIALADGRFDETKSPLPSDTRESQSHASFVVYQKFERPPKYENFLDPEHGEIWRPRTLPQVAKNTGWELTDSISLYCRECDLERLKVDKSDLAKWLDPLIDAGTLRTGSKGDYLVSLGEVWLTFKGIDEQVLREELAKKKRRDTPNGN